MRTWASALHSYGGSAGGQELGFYRVGFQLVVELRIGYGDQGFASLADRFAVQVRDSVLRDDVVHVASRSDYSGSGAQRGDDTRDRSILRRRREGDNWQTSF